MYTLKLCLKFILSLFRGDRRFEKPGRKDVGKVLTTEIFPGPPWYWCLTGLIRGDRVQSDSVPCTSPADGVVALLAFGILSLFKVSIA